MGDGFYWFYCERKSIKRNLWKGAHKDKETSSNSGSLCLGLSFEGWSLQTCIRNRWGQVVYEGKNDQWWDGTINGQPAATGAYYYTVTASNQFGQHETFYGVVTVLW
jgi:gliding motility-associated-like protein